MKPLTIRRYTDGCCAVIVGRRRGPKKHSKAEARRRYRTRGLIGYAYDSD